MLYVINDVSPFYYVDQAAFKDAFGKLSETQMVINDKYSEDKLTGTIKTLKENQTIQTTIPYDSGWIVTIDGKKVETYKTFDSLVAFDIAEAGDHDIVIKYRSKAFVYGMTLSVASTAIFALLIIFEKKIYGFIYAKFYKEPLTLPADSDSSKKEKKARGKKDGSDGDN